MSSSPSLVREVLVETGVRGDRAGQHGRGRLALAKKSALDGAILDISLANGFSFQIASLLKQRGIPYMFLSAHSDTHLVPAEFEAAPRHPSRSTCTS